ncbi:phytanoyl-CoA dioxygenase family protein [Kineococcus sp. SYSU DK002]|uniref:hypothetical protein n=1 Tax=Kineococcus sp. SYSU DK002 TaxID=3383123 RepID=UPI003D7ED2AE
MRDLIRRGHHRLTAEARRVVADLHRDGVARTSLAALAGDAGLLEDVLSRTDDLIADQSADIVRRRRVLAGEPVPRGAPLPDPHEVELLGPHPPVDPEDPYARFLRHPQISGIAAAHCRRDVRIWGMNGLLTLATAPVRDGDWVRSTEGPAVEVRLHLTGVDDGVGPLSYVRTSHRRRLAVHRLERTGRRIGDDDVTRVFGPAAATALTGATGTVVFTDPRGLHRRARPTTRDRLVLHGRFSARGGRERAVLLPAEEVPRSALPDFALA